MTLVDSNTPHSFFPFVSIVIPVYNGMRTIRTCLEAIFNQDYPQERFEVIIVDNNSSDGTPEFVQNYPVKLVYEREIQGPHAATNTGVKEAQGEILVFTDSDCVPEPDWLRHLVSPFADETVVGTGGRIEAYKPSTPVERFLDRMKPFKNAFQGNANFPAALITGNCAFRRNDFISAGMFNPNMYTGAEVDLSYRIQLQTGKRVVYVPEAVVYHIFSPTVRRLGRHFYIYGYSEILLGTIYKDVPGYPWTPTEQIKIMLRQVKALFTYMASFGFRVISFPFRGTLPQDYFLTPLLWFWVEANNLRGKIEGIWVTRFYRRKFWEKGVRVI